MPAVPLSRPFRDHLPRACVEILPNPFDPLVRSEDDLRVLRADLGEDDEVLGKLGDELDLALAREVDRPVGDLDVGEAVGREPALVLVELSAGDDGLEECPAADDRGLERAIEGDLLLEVVRHVGRAPAELDDVHVFARRVEEAFDLRQAHPLVDDVGEPLHPRLRRARGHVEEVVGPKVVHTAPPASFGPIPGRRGRARFRVSRSRPSAGRSP